MPLMVAQQDGLNQELVDRSAQDAHWSCGGPSGEGLRYLAVRWRASVADKSLAVLLLERCSGQQRERLPRLLNNLVIVNERCNVYSAAVIICGGCRMPYQGGELTPLPLRKTLRWPMLGVIELVA